MMKKKKRCLVRSAKTAALKRASERRAKSFFIVVIFLGLFVCMIVTELFYVEEERWQEERLLSMFSFGRGDPLDEGAPLAPRVARELTRVKYDAALNETAAVARSSPLDPPQEPDDFWQSVPDTKDKFFVFSAYYDDRRTKWVRVIAAARTRLADKVVCRFTYADPNREPVSVPGVNRLIRENWNLKYSAYFVLCPVKEEGAVPSHVSLVRQGGDGDGNRLAVHHNRARYRDARGIAVCIKPLHYEYNKVRDLVEFVELNRLLGVSHFVLYNHTVGAEAACVLRSYAHEGLVTLLPWELDLVSQKEIRTEGLFAALNDCLYRTMYRFRYVLMIDLDEYVIPQRNATLSAMLQHLMRRSPDRTGAYSFQNAFFYLQWPDDGRAASLPYPLLTLRKTVRKTKLHAHKQRSKCVVLPERVVEMGNHFVWEFVAGRTMVNVPPDVAFLHHYRVCEFGGNDCVNTTHLVDRRTHAWRDALVEAVALRLRLIQPVCQGVLKRMTL